MDFYTHHVWIPDVGRRRRFGSQLSYPMASHDFGALIIPWYFHKIVWNRMKSPLSPTHQPWQFDCETSRYQGSSDLEARFQGEMDWKVSTSRSLKESRDPTVVNGKFNHQPNSKRLQYCLWTNKEWPWYPASCACNHGYSTQPKVSFIQHWQYQCLRFCRRGIQLSMSWDGLVAANKLDCR